MEKKPKDAGNFVLRTIALDVEQNGSIRLWRQGDQVQLRRCETTRSFPTFMSAIADITKPFPAMERLVKYGETSYFIWDCHTEIEETFEFVLMCGSVVTFMSGPGFNYVYVSLESWTSEICKFPHGIGLLRIAHQCRDAILNEVEENLI